MAAYTEPTQSQGPEASPGNNLAGIDLKCAIDRASWKNERNDHIATWEVQSMLVATACIALRL